MNSNPNIILRVTERLIVIFDILESHAFQRYSTCSTLLGLLSTLESGKSEEVAVWAFLDQDKH